MHPLACPLCSGTLAPTRGRHGLVWLCRSCRAGAATLPVLREFAPRTFVNGLWQAALHGGRPSTLVCPSCRRRFTRLVAGGAGDEAHRLDVCIRCFWVWVDADGLSAFAAPARIGGARRPALPPPDARRALGVLAAGVVRRVL